ncbi:MAG: type II secretion system protein E [Betaproteobacteria bacterium HGW-Betaproteobacteria-8]|jgi:twitching motility protein PilT|nr:MAG: type II secretion system protein E [Betaproteobacteria bacterium HGW-Betaproteobacteria-8]
MNEQNENYLANVILSLLRSNVNFTDMQIGSDEPIKLKTSKGWINALINHDGADIEAPPMPVVPTMEDVQNFVSKIDENYVENLKVKDINRPLELTESRLRINAYLTKAGEQLRVAIRRINKKPPTLIETGLPAGARILTENSSGLILISGATGSGKTTTMASMLDDVINPTRNSHVITIEDPIEYVFEANKSFFSQREIGIDCISFAEGVKSAMRQRPEVIVIGEIRDRDTAEQALLAGESGHLVIGTLHANSAVGTVTKMLGFFGASERESRMQSLASCLVGIINQTLIPRLNGDGYVLAVDLVANHKREYSKLIQQPDSMQSMLDRADDGVSISLGKSVIKLIESGAISKADAVKAVAGNAAVYDLIRNLK